MVEKVAASSFSNRLVRRGVSEVYTRNSINIEVQHNPDSEAKLHDLMQQDYGIIEITNHWGLIEMPSVVKFNFQNPDLNKAKLLMPYAAHQFSEKHERQGKWMGATLLRTATDDADEYFRDNPTEKPEDYSELNRIYVKNAAGLLSHGGVVIFSPQGRRESYLPTRLSKPMLAAFLLGAQEEGLDLDRIALMAIGTGLNGVTDYDEWRDVKWNMPHPSVQINVGGIYTFSETGIRGSILTKADAWARNQLSRVVPVEYLHQPT